MQNQSNLLDIGSVPKRLNSVKSWYDPWIICVKAILGNKSPKGINFSPLSLSLFSPIIAMQVTVYSLSGLRSHLLSICLSLLSSSPSFFYLFIYLHEKGKAVREKMAFREAIYCMKKDIHPHRSTLNMAEGEGGGGGSVGACHTK